MVIAVAWVGWSDVRNKHYAGAAIWRSDVTANSMATEKHKAHQWARSVLPNGPVLVVVAGDTRGVNLGTMREDVWTMFHEPEPDLRRIAHRNSRGFWIES